MESSKEVPTLTYPKLLLFGDSLVQHSTRPGGLATLFAERYERQVDVIVRGFSGYNSEHLREILPSVLSGLGPGPIDATILFVGTNDATFKSSFQHVEMIRSETNLRHILTLLSGVSKHVVVVLPAYCEDSLQDDRCDRDLKEYSKTIATTLSTAETRQNFIPIPKLHLVSPRQILRNSNQKKWNGVVTEYDPDCFEDGLHFSPLGYRRLFDAIVSKLDDLEQHTWHKMLPSMDSFKHLSTRDQVALVKGHIALESESDLEKMNLQRNH